MVFCLSVVGEERREEAEGGGRREVGRARVRKRGGGRREKRKLGLGGG